MKHICIGITAHVDAGKTTLSEAMLFRAGALKKMGRVDHRDAFLDTFALERERGITIFSKQAEFSLPHTEVTLLDTPGHVDFSAEMERTLQVLDYAILVINGADGVQGHTQTLWRLLTQYKIPTFLFVNKMDQEGTDRERLLEELKKKLSGCCVDFNGELECSGAEAAGKKENPVDNSGKSPSAEGMQLKDNASEAEKENISGTQGASDKINGTDDFLENIAMCEENLLESFLETGTIAKKDVAELILERKLFPCFFGSALKMEGVDAFIHGMETYMAVPSYPAEFGARIFKIARDEQGNRLTYMKITGGSLKVKETLTNAGRNGIPAEEIWEEKADQIRIYSGVKFEMLKEAEAGTVCAVTGLTETYPGEGLGIEADSAMPVLEPVLNYQIILPEGCDAHRMLKSLKELEEEEPQLHIMWDEQLGEIHAMLMGEVQIEILKHLIWERFHVAVEFGTGNIVYKETIVAPVEGVGHFEPLRHYAEVHLLLEPGEPGSGLVFETDCSEDVLDRNWQRLILTHLAEKCHRGVLTGAPLTDVKITLLAGRAHVKHTEGGDFRQATWRAVRQGLMQAESVLLEPYYAFRIEVPAEQIGRAISDVRLMSGTFSSPETHGDMAVLTGRAPMATMRDYPAEVAAYTRGRGRISCSVAGYDTCHNAQEVIAESGYDPARDLDNTPDSVFCAHGAGTVIPWDRVRDYMHIDTGFGKAETQTPPPAPRMFRRRFDLDDRELEEILQREFGPIRRAQYAVPVRNAAPGADETERAELFHPRRERVIVDGYNVIFAWDELRALADSGHIDAARERLMDALSNYAAFTRREVVVVFDGYRVPGGQGEKFDRSGLHVVFTRQGETADAYMEKLADEIGKNESVRVVTSDALIQLTALRAGVLRMSAREFRQELAQVAQQLEAAIRDINGR